MHSDNLEHEIARVVQSVNEWDDRTSPEEYPDHLLITSEELADILRNFAGNVCATAAPNLPEDVVASLCAIGPVEWGRSFEQSDEKHVSDFVDTLRITREHFGTEGETAIHGVYLAGTNTVLAHTGSSPNSPQHARILVGAWNHLVEQAVTAPEPKGI